MSTATATPTSHTIWTYAAALLAALTLVVGILVASQLGSPGSPPVAEPVTAPVVDGGPASCTARLEVTGGVLEGDTFADRCGPAGGQVRRGGIQP